MTERATIRWIDRGREPKCPPNPDYPNGLDLVVPNCAEPNCTFELPYPAKRCGVWVVTCHICGVSYACTTAGRPDDPRSFTFPCKLKEAAPQ